MFRETDWLKLHTYHRMGLDLGHWLSVARVTTVEVHWADGHIIHIGRQRLSESAAVYIGSLLFLSSNILKTIPEANTY